MTGKEALAEIALAVSEGRRANLSGAYLGEADLREANLSRANLREASLSRANQLLRLDMTDPREYQPVAVAWADGWRIASGCRWFTVPGALDHWGSPNYIGNKAIAARYLRAINDLPPCPTV